jgi:hypothetical protein
MQPDRADAKHAERAMLLRWEEHGDGTETE